MVFELIKHKLISIYKKIMPAYVDKTPSEIIYVDSSQILRIIENIHILF